MGKGGSITFKVYGVTNTGVRSNELIWNFDYLPNIKTFGIEWGVMHQTTGEKMLYGNVNRYPGYNDAPLRFTGPAWIYSVNTYTYAEIAGVVFRMSVNSQLSSAGFAFGFHKATWPVGESSYQVRALFSGGSISYENVFIPGSNKFVTFSNNVTGKDFTVGMSLASQLQTTPEYYFWAYRNFGAYPNSFPDPNWIGAYYLKANGNYVDRFRIFFLTFPNIKQDVVLTDVVIGPRRPSSENAEDSNDTGINSPEDNVSLIFQTENETSQ